MIVKVNLTLFVGTPTRTASATLHVDVLDINDNPPHFREDYRPVVPENTDPPLKVIEIFADDPDLPPLVKPWFKFQLDVNADAVIKQSFKVDFNKGKYKPALLLVTIVVFMVMIKGL